MNNNTNSTSARLLQFTEKEFLEIISRAKEKHPLLTQWESKFLHNLHWSYRNNQLLTIEQWISEEQVNKLREISRKLWRD